MRLTLLVPELLWPEPEDDLAWQGADLPALATLLHRGRLTRRPPLAPEAQAARWLGLPTPPLGALRLLGERDSGLDAREGVWLCADPIHLRLHQEEIIVADSRELALTEEETLELAAGLNAHYQGEARFHPVSPGRWYLELTTEWADELPWDVLPPLSAAAGRRLNLPRPGELASRRLLALMNEIQMLLHSAPVNEARGERGQATINGLWLWGPGQLSATAHAPEAGATFGSDPMLRGMALAAGLECHSLESGYQSHLQAMASGKRHLAAISSLALPAQDQDAQAWQAALTTLEAEWFAPARAALAKGALTELEILASTSYGDLSWSVTRRDLGGLFAFLKPKPDPLQAQARHLAQSSTGENP